MKTGHLAKSIAYAKAIVFAKWSVWVKKSKYQKHAKNYSTTTRELFYAKPARKSSKY